MKANGKGLGLYFLFPSLLAFLVITALGFALTPPEEAPGAPVGFAIIFLAVFPVVAFAVLMARDVQSRGIILLGGSFVKVVVILVLTLWVRAQLPAFGDKKSFLIWLFLSFLIVSSLGWFVVAARVPTGGESGGAGHR